MTIKKPYRKYHYIPQANGEPVRKEALELTAIEQEFVRNTKNLDYRKKDAKDTYQQHLKKLFENY